MHHKSCQNVSETAQIPCKSLSNCIENDQKRAQNCIKWAVFVLFYEPNLLLVEMIQWMRWNYVILRWFCSSTKPHGSAIWRLYCHGHHLHIKWVLIRFIETNNWCNTLLQVNWALITCFKGLIETLTTLFYTAVVPP